MLVGMAAGAFGGEAQKRATEILARHRRLGLRRNVCRLMTAAAVEARMPAFQRVSGLAVVKGGERGLPMDQRDIRAIVFRVTGDAAAA
jgi:hypothetical protein